MIERISKAKSQNFMPVPFFSHQPPRAICSIHSLNPVSWIERCFSLFLRFIQWLFCHETKSYILSENNPEIDPKSLPRKDPFCNQVFTFDSGRNFAFRHKEAYEKTSELFQILGTTSYWSWITHFLSLTAREKEVKNFKSSSLTFLYYIFCNKAHTSHILHFKQQAMSGRWVLKLKTGKDPWEDFLGTQAKNFDKSNDIFNKLPGFCKALNLDEKTILKLAKAKNWRKLITFVLKERKKHFKL